MASDVGKGKAVVEEKGKRVSHRTRIGMDFDPKTSKHRDQEAVDKYLASYSFHLNLGIKIKFCPHSVDVSLAPPNKDGVYMHPQVLALGLRLPTTRFIRSVLIFLQGCSLLVVGDGLAYQGIRY